MVKTFYSKSRYLLAFGLFFLAMQVPMLYGQGFVSDTTLISAYLEKARTGKSDSSFHYSLKAAGLAGKLLNGNSLTGKTKDKVVGQLIKAELNTGLFYYRETDYKRALEHYHVAYKWAKILQKPYYLGECLFNFAEVNLEQSEYSQAMTHYFGALQEYARAGDKTSIYWCYTGMGIVQKQCGNYTDAVICYEKALAIAIESSMKIERAYCYNNLGNVYRKQGNLAKAMDVYEKAISCFTKMKDNIAVSDCLNNIGNLYMERNDPFRSLDYYNRSMQIEGVEKDNYRMVTRYKNLADAYSLLKDYTNASLFLDKAMSLAEKTGDKSLMASCYSQTGSIHVHKGTADIGISYLKKASEMFGSIGAKAEQAETLVELANAELSVGLIDNAASHAETGEQLAVGIGALQILASASACLAKIWEKKGNASKSLVFMKNVVRLKDSIFSTEKSRAIEEVEAGFTRTKLENENQILAQNGELQQQALKIRNIALLSLAMCFILSLIVIWLVIKRHQDSKSKAQHAQALKQKEIEQLNENLLLKERELTTKTVYISRKNSMLKNIIEELDALKKEPSAPKNRIDRLQHELKQELSPDAWKEFEVQFNDVHPGFQERLLERFPELTPTERRLCAFLRLNMNTREIASLTGQSFKSIEVARTRIRKKMEIRREDNLANFISGI